MNILEEILESKKSRLALSKKQTPPGDLRARAINVQTNREPHRLRAALSDNERINIIAEIKRASPSKGMIRGDIDSAMLARAYETGGAAAISILTEADYFHGSLDDLRSVRQSVRLPLLRKDFIFDEYQVYESAAAGADALLLITAVLEDDLLGQLRQMTEDELKMDAVVEVHTVQELNRAAKCGASIIGVNNRDLRTFEVSLETSFQLAPSAPDGAVLISESGIESGEHIRRLRGVGYHGFLVGESLMRADNAEETLRTLISGVSDRHEA